jgi:hypothetical protein
MVGDHTRGRCAPGDLLHSPALAPGASVRMRLAAQRQVQVSKSSVSRGKTLLHTVPASLRESDLLKLTMSLHTDLLAHIQNGTGGTVREVTGANMFAEGDEQTVDLDPIAAREFGFKFQKRFFRG